MSCDFLFYKQLFILQTSQHTHICNELNFYMSQLNM